VTRRLDAELVVRGLARSRGQARELLAAGTVLVDGVVTMKAASPTSGASQIVLSEPPEPWVGRAALKLVHALDTWGAVGSGPGQRAASAPADGQPVRRLDPRGLRCLDVGASTGGFTQALLAHGAASVTALDVGHGQLAPSIAADPRVVDRSGTNIRLVGPEDLGGRFDLVVADLSFISLGLALQPMRAVTAADGDLIVLVKPQFEVGRHRLGRGGVVRSAALHAEVLRRVHDQATEAGLAVLAGTPSPIRGGEGNREFLLWLTPRPEASGLSVDDMLDGMDLEADP
jgi:23S rRNA (cytidine1920-2'-O)/16S rRNA (cytidine1409-2'-O)-methyltransferase